MHQCVSITNVAGRTKLISFYIPNNLSLKLLYCILEQMYEVALREIIAQLLSKTTLCPNTAHKTCADTHTNTSTEPELTFKAFSDVL